MDKYDHIITQYVNKREEDDKYQKKIYQKFHDILFNFKDQLIP